MRLIARVLHEITLVALLCLSCQLCWATSAEKPSVQAIVNYEKSYDVLMSNVVNANTPGFRSSKTVMLQDGRDILCRVVTDLHTPGALQRTGKPLDVAIDGKGFFQVIGPRGFLYTRDGRFKLDADLRLVTLVGSYPVLGEDGVIALDTTEVGLDQLVIAGSGEISLEGSIIGRFLVGEFLNPAAVASIGGVFFYVKSGEDNANFMPLPIYKVHQYFIENSNVNVSEELVTMPQISKKFDANSKVLQIMKKIKTTGREMGRQ